MYSVERLNGHKVKEHSFKTEICVQTSQPIRNVTSGSAIDFPELKFPACNIDKYM